MLSSCSYWRACPYKEEGEDGGWHDQHASRALRARHDAGRDLEPRRAHVSEYTGRGPTKARTHISDDVVTVMLRDTLTKGERSLVSDGREELVLSMRKAFQRTMRSDLVAGVEEILGRKVIAFFSDNSIDPDAAAEVFLLAPSAGNGDGG